jgi:NADH:ubiquinone oxidoreductase subunit H
VFRIVSGLGAGSVGRMDCILQFLVSFSRWLVCPLLCAIILAFVFFGGWRDDDPEEWVFISCILFSYQGAFLLELTLNMFLSLPVDIQICSHFS